MLYGALDNNQQRVGTPFKASRIGKDVGYTALQKKCEKTEQTIKANPQMLEKTKEIIRKNIETASGIDEFINKLKEENLSVVFRKNKENRLYGVTFIDHNLKMVYNGSRLGKEFSANQFHELFRAKEKPIENDAIQKENLSDVPAQVADTTSCDTPRYLDHTMDYDDANYYSHPNDDTLIGTAEALDLFAYLLEEGAKEQYEPHLRIRNKKKRKKRVIQ